MPGPLSAYDNSDQTSGLTMAPGVQPAPSMQQVWDATATQTRAIGQTNSRSYYEADDFARGADWLNAHGYSFTGADGQKTPFGVAGKSQIYDPTLGYHAVGSQEVERQYWQAFEDAHAKGIWKGPTHDAYEKMVAQRMAADVQQSSDVLNRSSGWLSFGTQLASGMAQGLHDPAQWALMGATGGIGAVAGSVAEGSGMAARIAGVLAPRTAGAGLSPVAAFTRNTLAAMTREGTVFAAGQAALNPLLDQNKDVVGIHHDAGTDFEDIGHAFLQGAGFAGVGAVAKPILNAVAAGVKGAPGLMSSVSQDAMARLYPHMPEAMRDYMAARSDAAGTAPLRNDLAGAVDGAARSPMLAPEEADSVRIGARHAIDAEINPFIGVQGAETHGSMLAAGRTAMAMDRGAPPVRASGFGAPKADTRKLSQANIIRFVQHDLEGGDKLVHYSQADGGLTKFGIAQRDNPGVFVGSLTEGQAFDIAKTKYWYPELDSQKPELAAIAFDASYASGPSYSKRLLHESQGDAGIALTLYREHLRHIAETVPGKAKYLEGWMNRVDKLGKFVRRREKDPGLFDGAGAAGDNAAPVGGGAADPFEAEQTARVAALDAEQAGIDQESAAAAQQDEEPFLFGDMPTDHPAEPPPPPMPPINPELVGEHVPGMPVMDSPFEERPIYSRNFDPRELTTDAAAMQYKGGGDAHGVTDRLRDSTPWVQSFSGKVMVFEQADGRFVIADGHQRLGKAMRTVEANPEANIWLNADVMREADGWTPMQARVAAALKNIAEGSGTVEDAARVLREAPQLQALLPRSGAYMRVARGLSRLDHETFGAVLNGVMSVEHGAAIGNNAGHAPESHVPLMRLLAGVSKHDEGLANQIVRQALVDGFGRSDAHNQLSMFGDAPAQALYAPMAKILENAKKLLREDKKVFGKLVEAEAKITGVGGNALDHAANARKVLTSEQAQVIIERTAQSSGPVRDALRAAATDILGRKRSLAGATRDFLERLEGVNLRDAAAGIGASGEDGAIHDAAGSPSAVAGAHDDLSGGSKPAGRAGEPSGVEPPSQHVIEQFSNPHDGPGVKAQADQLLHDFLKEGAAKESEAVPPAPPEAHMPDLKTFRAEDRFAVSGEGQALGAVLHQLQGDAEAIAALRGCM